MNPFLGFILTAATYTPFDAGAPADDAVGPGMQGVYNLMSNIGNTIEMWGKALVAIFGVIMIVIGVMKIAKGLSGGGRSNVSWPLCIALILIGAMMAYAGAWQIMVNLGGGAASTLDKIGTGALDRVVTPRP